MCLWEKGTNALDAASAASMARYREFATVLSGSALPGTERWTKNTCGAKKKVDVDRFRTWVWRRMCAGCAASHKLGSRPKTLMHTKGPEGGVPIEEVGTRQKSEKARMSMSEGSRSLRKKLRHFARSVTKALAAQCDVWSGMEKELLGMQSERKSTHDEIREAKMLHAVDEKAFLQVEKEYGGVGLV